MKKSNEGHISISLKGTPASPGIAIGAVYVMGTGVKKILPQKLSDKNVKIEIEKFQSAVNKAKEELQVLRDQTAQLIDEESARIFDSHILMLEDELIVDQTINRIKTEKKNADYIFSNIIENMELSLKNLDNEYFREKSADLRDVQRRVVYNIQGETQGALSDLKVPSIIVAKELTPSETITLDKSKVLGFVTDFGGRTSHGAIMARALKVPSVVGLVSGFEKLKTGDKIVLDANEGIVYLNPNSDIIKEYKKLTRDYHNFELGLKRIKELPPRTKDGKDIDLSANIEFPHEARNIRNQGAQGIGLYRTEYLYFTKHHLPSEEEQYEEYVQILSSLGNQPIIIRTFDLGGDKFPDSFKFPVEANPFLGLRAIRIYRKYTELFKTQLRAILRASVFGQVRIMFPMISCVSEMRFCQNFLQTIRGELELEGKEFSRDIPIGAMIEVPSAAVVADLIARECDFLSIGTNDLIQYSLAVDRGNENVAYLYKPYNPSILRLVHDIVKKGHEQSVWVGMCGEMASDPLATMLLIGLGLDEFSVSPVSLLHIKEIIRRVEYSECENMAERVLSYSTTEQVENYLKSVYKAKFKDFAFGYTKSATSKFG